MTRLFDLVKREIENSFVGSDFEWEFFSENDSLCHAKSENISILFSLDLRDKSIESAIGFTDLAQNLRENIDTHVATKMFPDQPYKQANGSLDDRVGDEVRNVRNVLFGMERDGISARELFFFVDGYNKAYTDYASGEFD